MARLGLSFNSTIGLYNENRVPWVPSFFLLPLSLTARKHSLGTFLLVLIPGVKLVLKLGANFFVIPVANFLFDTSCKL